MNKINWRRILGISLAGILFFVTACTSAPPSDSDQAQQESTPSETTSVVEESASAANLNSYLPASHNGYTLAYNFEN